MVIALTLLMATTGAVVGGVAFADTPMPPLPHTTLAFTSDPQGVGQGVHRSLDSSVDKMTATLLSPANVIVNASDLTNGGLNWTLTVRGPSGLPLAVGSYGGLGDVNTQGAPYLDFSGNGRSCGGLDDGDAFTVKDIAYTGETLTRLDVVFEHHCGLPTDFGELRVGEPDLAGVTLPWQSVVFPATPVGTSATTAFIPVVSTSASADNLAYSVDGPADHPFAMSPGNCGSALLGHATCTLMVTFTARQVGTVSGTLTVQVGSVRTLIPLTGTTGFGSTLMAFNSHPGDEVGNGSGAYLFDAANSTIQTSGDSSTFTGSIYGLGGPFQFTFSAASGGFEPGTYLAGSTDSHRIELSVTGQGRSCGALTPDSFVEVRQVQLSAAGRAARFDASFSQTCQGSTGALTGRIEYNATASVQQVVAPVRVLDTRSHQGSIGGSIPAYGSITVPMGAVPAMNRPDVTSAMLDVVVVRAGSAGYLSAGAGGSAPNASSTMNFSSGQTIANLVSVPMGPSKSVTLWNHSATAEAVVADLQAISVASDSDASGAVVPLPVTRVTVSAGAGQRTVVGGHAELTVNLAAYATGPATGMSAALANLTVVGAGAAGYITLGVPGKALPNSSAMTFSAAATTAALAVVPLDATGAFILYNGSAKPITVILDLQGYYSTGTQAGTIGSVTAFGASRIIDTRIGLGTPRQAIGPGQSIAVNMEGPPQGAYFTITATQATSGGYLSLSVTKANNPAGTSVLNFTPQQNRSNLTVTGLGIWGLTITNHSSGSVQVLVDLDGAIT